MTDYTSLTGISKEAADDFEQKLAMMADAEISQSFPALTEKKVGFQLIDKNDDGTRGVGVMVYKDKEQWIFIPVFFLNGRLRGFDEMYLPDKSQFVPAQDNWLSYIRSSSPVDIGNPSKRDSKSNPKGPGSIQLDPERIESRLIPKTATLLGMAGGLADMLNVPGAEPTHLDLRTWLPRLGKTAAASFMHTMNSSPDFANAVLAFYSPEDIETMVKTAAENSDQALKVQAAPHEATKLSIYTSDDLDAASEKLDDKAKEVLLRDGVYVVDGREDTSTVFQPKDALGLMATPTKTGYYSILMSDGTTVDFYAVVQTTAPGDKSVPTTYLIPLNEPRQAKDYNEPLLARRLDREAGDISSFGMGVDAFINAAREESGMYLLLDDKGNSERLCVSNSAFGVRGDMLVGLRRGCLDESETKLQLTGSDGSLYTVQDTIQVPTNARFVRIKYASDKPVYSFGDIDTLRFKVQKTAGMQPLKIYTDGCSWSIDGIFGAQRSLSKTAALINLVKGHGIEAATAKHMLLYNGVEPKVERYLVKYALSMDDLLGSSASRMEPAPDLEEQEIIEPTKMKNKDIESAVDASDKGVKDVMDVSVLRALAMSGSAARLTNEYISDMLLGLDRIGRVLFLFYWHNDDYRERYGSDKMMELEDSLRDSFQGLGDLILFLHKSTTEPAGDLFSNDLSGNIG